MENPTESKHIVCFGEFELDLRTGELSSNSHRIILQERPFQLLAALLERPREMVTREELTKRLWPAGTFVDFNLGLNKAVNRLREVLDDSADKPRFIETFPKRGYRFVASITRDRAKQVDTSATTHLVEERNRGREPASTSLGSDGVQVSYSSPAVASGKGSWRSVAVAVVTICIGLAAWHTVRSRVSRGLRPNLEKFQVTKLTDSGKVELVAISSDGRYVGYAMREREGSGLWLRQVTTHSDIQILPADAVGFEGLTFSPDANHIYYVRADSNDPGFKYLYVMPALGGSSRLLIKDIDSPVSFSPDGQRFVYTRGIPTRNANDLRIASTDGSGDHLLARIENTYPSFQPGATWSPDGRIIIVPLLRFGKQSFVLYAVSVSDGSVHELDSSSHTVGRPLWLPEGDALLLVMGDQNGRGQLWTITYPKAEVRRVTNDLTDYRVRADLTRDAKTMVAIANSGTSNVWVAPVTNLSQAKQITSLASPLFEVVEAPDGRLLAAGQDGKLWSLRADGSERRLFADVDGADQPASCGRYLVFSSFQSTTNQIMRVDASGADVATLASGDLGSLVCSPDGKYVFYEDFSPRHRILRIPVEGGESVEVARVLGEFLVGRLSISPDGKRLAYPYEEYSPAPILKLAIISAEGGPLTVITAPGGAYGYGSLLWSPDGKNLQYVLTENGASNVWEQPLDGNKPRQLTTFSSGEIFDFHWSLDGRRLLLTRGEVSSDAVLISNLR
jgi:DNA-binding winged helix-turn-helix (wHTH) protein/Tol biopolymer transport system component